MKSHLGAGHRKHFPMDSVCLLQVMLGENGTGKTTFIRMLAGALDADRAEGDIPQFRVSYKPQKISPKFPGSVRLRIPDACAFLEQSLACGTRKGPRKGEGDWVVFNRQIVESTDVVHQADRLVCGDMK